MKETILIVEDEAKVAALLDKYLTSSGFHTHTLMNGTAVASWVREHRPDLILLDLMLPGKDGMEVCKEVRSFSRVPIIMETARVEEIDRLLGFEIGADDYICKPFSPREVVARVKSVLRRTRDANTLQSENITLDEHSYKAMFRNHDLDLTAIEFRLLQLLVSNPHRIYNRQQIMSHIYPDTRFVNDRTIDSHILKLRKKIEEFSPESSLIQSVYGVGYKYEP
jgi:two-component system, OmpR family, response regulator BaeR